MPVPFLIRQTVFLVAAYVAHNPLQASELQRLLQRTHAALANLVDADPTSPGSAVRRGVFVSASITEDALISFIDGKPYKSLKRHLAAHGLSPDDYRSRYGLPWEYPMVAPSYGALRSRIAKRLRPASSDIGRATT